MATLQPCLKVGTRRNTDMIGPGGVRTPAPQLTRVDGGTIIQAGLGEEISAHNNGLQIGVWQLRQNTTHPLLLQAGGIHAQHVVIRHVRWKGPASSTEASNLEWLLQHAGVKPGADAGETVSGSFARAIAIEGMGEAVAEAAGAGPALHCIWAVH